MAQMLIVRTDLAPDDHESGEQLLVDIEDMEHVVVCERYESARQAREMAFIERREER